MIRAYDEHYLSKAQIALAHMLRYATTDLCYEIDRFFEMFIESGIAAAFENGTSHYTVGMSGVELAREVVFRITGKTRSAEPSWSLEKTPVYWCGWALSYYQWYSAHTFQDIYAFIRPSKIVCMYDPFHEMDILHFVDALDKIIPRVDITTHLARLRKEAGISQRLLAYASGISVRMIQNYEQRRKDINKAQGETVHRLSVALGCDMADLLEMPGAKSLNDSKPAPCFTSQAALPSGSRAR